MNRSRYLVQQYRNLVLGSQKRIIPYSTKIFYHAVRREKPDQNPKIFSLLSSKIRQSQTIQTRFLWAWLNSVFNRVDESRIKEVGPNRACAEWLLRCGAFVKWSGTGTVTKDYNTLPVSGMRTLKIEEVDGTESAVMHRGFRHFRGCKNIRKITFHKCIYLTDEALAELHYLKDSLVELQISSCGNISIEGLRHLAVLQNLGYLHLYDLPGVSDKDKALKELENSLPNCAVLFPYA